VKNLGRKRILGGKKGPGRGRGQFVIRDEGKFGGGEGDLKIKWEEKRNFKQGKRARSPHSLKLRAERKEKSFTMGRGKKGSHLKKGGRKKRQNLRKGAKLHSAYQSDAKGGNI